MMMIRMFWWFLVPRNWWFCLNSVQPFYMAALPVYILLFYISSSTYCLVYILRYYILLLQIPLKPLSSCVTHAKIPVFAGKIYHFRAQTDPKTTGFSHVRPWCSGRGRARGGENDDALAPPAVPGSGLWVDDKDPQLWPWNGGNGGKIWEDMRRSNIGAPYFRRKHLEKDVDFLSSLWKNIGEKQVDILRKAWENYQNCYKYWWCMLTFELLQDNELPSFSFFVRIRCAGHEHSWEVPASAARN